MAGARRAGRAAALAAVLAVWLAACSGEAPVETASPAAGAEAAAPGPDAAAEAAGHPAGDPGAGPDAGNDASTGAELADSPAGTSGVTGFHGFGPARFGDDVDALRIAWGRPLALTDEAAEGGRLRCLRPDPPPSPGLGIAFLLEEGRLAGYRVSGDQYQAPGGGRVGNSRAALESLYRDRITPVAGAPDRLRVAGPQAAATALLFELDAAGRVQAWRIGLPAALADPHGCR